MISRNDGLNISYYVVIGKMRVIVEANNEKKEFYSMKEAMKHYEYKSYKKFAEEMKFKRVYDAGHWNTVDIDYLKMITVRKYRFAD